MEQITQYDSVRIKRIPIYKYMVEVEELNGLMRIARKLQKPLLLVQDASVNSDPVINPKKVNVFAVIDDKTMYYCQVMKHD